MSTTSQITPMELVRPMVEGIIAIAMVSAMTSIMAMATSTTVSAAGIHTMGSFVPYIGTGKKKQKGPSTSEQRQSTRGTSSSMQEELSSLNLRISKLDYVMANQAEAMKGTREHKEKLMREYKLYVMPSMVELSKHPKLKATDYFLRTAEKNYDRMELSMMFLQKRRKELQVKLGIRAEEEERKRTYTVMKKFREPIRREF